MSLALALGTTVLLRAWPPTRPDAGLLMRVEVPRDDRHVLVETPRTALPTQHAIDALTSIADETHFRVTWEGIYHAPDDGLYALVTRSDDGSWVWVDDRLVVDNGGLHGAIRRSGVVPLTAGPHALRIVYEQHGGPQWLEVRLREPDGVMRRIDAFALQLSPGPVSTTARLARTARAALPVVAIWAWYVAYGSLLTTIGVWLFRRVEALAGTPRAGWSLVAVLVVFAVVAAPGLQWGLPADFDGWAPDEVSPRRQIAAVDAGFMVPWASLYPPIAFYLWTPLVIVLRIVGTPEGLAASQNPGAFHLHVAMRAVSLLMATGTLASLYLVVRTWWGRAEALTGAALAGVGVSFLYYAKTANVDVPYLYWLLLAVAAFGAFVRTGGWAALRWVAACGALAIATKDQAAGYLLFVVPALPGIALAHAWRGSLRSSLPALWRREWLQATVIGVLVLASAYLWSWDNVMAHADAVRRGRYAPMVEGTLAGQMRLLRLHVELLVFMLAPAVAAFAAAGLVIAWRERRWGWLTVVLLPAASNVLGLLTVIRYTYDRFLLGVALLLACAAAPAVVAAWRAPRWRLAARSALMLAGLATALHGVSTNVLMLGDGRHAVEDRLSASFDVTRLVARLSPTQYMPRLGEQPAVDLPLTRAALEEWQPSVLLLNANHASRTTMEADERAFLEALRSGELGFVRTLSHRASPPVWALAWHWPYFHGRRADGLTNLDKINPEIEIWTRAAGVPR